jgi:hypothetical protein
MNLILNNSMEVSVRLTIQRQKETRMHVCMYVLHFASRMYQALFALRMNNTRHDQLLQVVLLGSLFSLALPTRQLFKMLQDLQAPSKCRRQLSCPTCTVSSLPLAYSLQLLVVS